MQLNLKVVEAPVVVSVVKTIDALQIRNFGERSARNSPTTTTNAAHISQRRRSATTIID